MRYMGIDYGTVRVGVALSDPMGIIATGLETIMVDPVDETYVISRLLQIISEHKVEHVVVGLPRRTDGKSSPSEEGAKKLANQLKEQVSIPVVLRDERYTSVIANRILRDSSVKKKKKKLVVDQVAAEVILNDYLQEMR